MKIPKGASRIFLAELVGTTLLSYAILASLYGVVPLLATAVVAGFVLFILTLSLGHVSGMHVNPAITIAMYSIRKIDERLMVVYLLAQALGAVLAMVIMSMFQNGILIQQLTADADYPTFFAEFLGTFVFAFGVAASIGQKFKPLDHAALIGGSLTLGIFCASIASNGVLNPSVALTISSFNWAYLLGPIFGAIIGVNAYALSFGKKGRI